MDVLANITLNLQRPDIGGTVYAVQNDTRRSVRATLTDGDALWTPPAGALVMIEVAKPDGLPCLFDTLEDGSGAYAIEGSVVTFTFAEQALTAPGLGLFALRFYTAAGERLATFRRELQIVPSAVPDDEIESTEYFNILTQQIEGLLNATTHPPKITTTAPYTWLVWDEENNRYTDTGVPATGPQGETGPPEIPTTQVRYQAGSSPTTAPTGTWLSSPPTVPPGQYLWTRTRLTYSSGATATSYSVAYQGQNGSGTLITLFQSVSVAVSAWENDSTYPDFPFHADVTLSGVTANDFVEVVFGLTEATGGMFAPICEARAGSVRIWAAEKPSAAVTIPTIATWR